jgi:hypothetical protein
VSPRQLFIPLFLLACTSERMASTSMQTLRGESTPQNTSFATPLLTTPFLNRTFSLLSTPSQPQLFPLRNRYSTTYGFDADFAWESAKASTPQERVEATQAYLDLGLMHRVTLNTFVSATSDALAADPPDWASFDAAWGR